MMPGDVTPGGHYLVKVKPDAAAALAGALGQSRPFVDLQVFAAQEGVRVDVVRNARRFDAAAATPNQAAVAQAVENLGAGNGLYDTIATQYADGDARRAFDLLSGETHAAAKGMLVETSHFARNAVLGRLRTVLGDVAEDAPGDVPGHATDGMPLPRDDAARPRNAWAQGFGAWSRHDGDRNSASLESRTGGFFVGADRQLGRLLRAGLLAGYSHTDFGSMGRWSKGRSHNYHLGAYGGASWDAWRLRLGVINSWHDLRTVRHVGFAGLYEKTRALSRADHPGNGRGRLSHARRPP